MTINVQVKVQKSKLTGRKYACLHIITFQIEVQSLHQTTTSNYYINVKYKQALITLKGGENFPWVWYDTIMGL